MNEDRFTFFWHGPFSQWHTCRFRADLLEGECPRSYAKPQNTFLDGYNCAEQYMMERKALLFRDFEMATRIRFAATPREQKALGRKVRDFDAAKWNAAARDIVFRGNWAKFTQNDGLREELLATRGTTLVEASPVDTIWGIGLAKDDPRAQDRATWLGTNWLGEVLTAVRDAIEFHSDRGSLDKEKPPGPPRPWSS